MTPDIFSTQAFRPRDQFEAWREWYSSVFEVMPRDPIGDGFPGEIRLWNLGGLAISRTIAASSQISRTKSHVRRDPVDHWVISYCARGAHLAKTGDTELEVPARTPYLWSLGQEFLHERTHVDRVQFLMARDTFRDIGHLLDAICGSVLDSPLGHLLGDYMMALEGRLAAVTESDFPHVTKAVGAIVAAAIEPSAERMAIAQRQIDLGRKERVRQAVRRHLRTPTLGPKNLGRLIGMSRSNLYRLLEDMGGVTRYIQRERLLEAHVILSGNDCRPECRNCRDERTGRNRRRVGGAPHGNGAYRIQRFCRHHRDLAPHPDRGSGSLGRHSVRGAQWCAGPGGVQQHI